MIRKNAFTPGRFVVFTALCLFVITARAGQYTYNLKVPTGNCRLVQISNCFNDSTRQTAFDVGSEVTSLSNLYRFCTQIQVYQKGKPARIVLALDNSGSMCMEVTSCPGASKNDPGDKRIQGANAFVDSVAKRCPECEIGVINYEGVGNDSTGAKTITGYQDPLKLSAENVATLHGLIDEGRCSKPSKRPNSEKGR
jgi:hypothetical protein